MTWQQSNGYQELVGEDFSITLEPRPHYCDRGNFIAKYFTSNHLKAIDDCDGWPRYYFDEQRAKLEIEAWLLKRNLITNKSIDDELRTHKTMQSMPVSNR